MIESYFKVKPLEKLQMIEVIRFVTDKKEIGMSELQIKFSWGYNRAGNTMIELEKLGIVESFKGLRYRAVLVTKEQAQEIIYNLKYETNS